MHASFTSIRRTSLFSSNRHPCFLIYVTAFIVFVDFFHSHVMIKIRGGYVWIFKNTLMNISWLKSKITYSKIGEYCEINTHFPDNSNDYLQIYAKQERNEIYFIDDGVTLNELEMGG